MRFLPFVAAALFVCVGVAQAANAFDAKAYVDGMARQVLNTVTGDGDLHAKQDKIEALFADKLDIDFISKFVLGKHWRTATPKQQQDYMAAYRPFVLKNFALRLTKYSGQTYEIGSARTDGEATLVSMTMHDTNGKDFMIDYRVQGSKIVDIMVEGVSLLATQRAEFNSVVENNGLDYLIGKLQASATKG